MFQSARVQLTAWYLLIIMVISIAFSVSYYNTAMRDVQDIIRKRLILQDRLLRDPYFRLLPEVQDGPNFDDIAAYEKRITTLLIGLNTIIFFSAGAAGYFLAGRTLRPIKRMVTEQNRFITDASHELRTPLTALRAEIEATLLEDKISSAEAKQILQSNLEEVIKLQYLSNNLLQLAQFQNPSQRFAFSPVNITEVIDDAVKKMSSVAKEKSIEIVTDTEDEEIHADKQSIYQLILILIDNAIKYSPQDTKINISAHKIDSKIKITVKDQGIGIPDKDIPHIFDRFYRSDESRTKADTPGYGLGLAIAKKITEAHKGSIMVKSKVDEGTTFSILLPTKL